MGSGAQLPSQVMLGVSSRCIHLRVSIQASSEFSHQSPTLGSPLQVEAIERVRKEPLPPQPCSCSLSSQPLRGLVSWDPELQAQSETTFGFLRLPQVALPLSTLFPVITDFPLQIILTYPGSILLHPHFFTHSVFSCFGGKLFSITNSIQRICSFSGQFPPPKSKKYPPCP